MCYVIVEEGFIHNTVMTALDYKSKNREVKIMKKHDKNLTLILGKFTCVMAMALAILSVNSTCGFTAYQPDVPESIV